MQYLEIFIFIMSGPVVGVPLLKGVSIHWVGWDIPRNEMLKKFAIYTKIYIKMGIFLLSNFFKHRFFSVAIKLTYTVWLKRGSIQIWTIITGLKKNKLQVLFFQLCTYH